MKQSRLLWLALLVAVASIAPAYAATDGDPVKALRQQVAALNAKVTKLDARQRKLSAENRTLREIARRVDGHNAALVRFAATHGDCAVTRPNGDRPPGPVPGSTFHGNGTLWVGLRGNGVFVVDRTSIRSDGRIGIKLGWWRGRTGALSMASRRLDAPASPGEASIPEGYGESGFQSTSLVLPTEGCWEVTGRLNESTLSVTVLVLRAPN